MSPRVTAGAYVLGGVLLLTIGGIAATLGVWSTGARSVSTAKPINLWQPSSGTVHRTITVAQWDTLWTFPPHNGDESEYSTPRLLVADGSRVYVYDQQSRMILALDEHGRVIWKIGSGTKELGTFGSGVDMKLAPDGMLNVLDPESARIIRIDTGGKIVGRVVLAHTPRIAQFAPIDGGRSVLMPILGGTDFDVIGPNGSILNRTATPWAGVQNLNPLARQGTLMSNRGGTWIFAFSFGDGWFGFRDTTPLSYLGRYVEYKSFPDVTVITNGRKSSGMRMEDAECTACALAMSDSSVFFLAGGSSTSMRRLIDEFSLSSGSYLRSYQLPQPMIALSVVDGQYYVISTGLTARHVLALRPKFDRARDTATAREP